MNLDDIRSLNIREAGNWPVAAKLGAFTLIVLVIVGLGAFLDWKDQWEALDKARTEETTLKTQYSEKKAKAINLELYSQQLKEVEQSFGALVKQLPNRAEIDALLTDINQAGLGRGLTFELFKPAVQEKMADFYAELPINIKITVMGYAQSNARVSTLMRNIEGSPWLEKPELVEIKLVNQPGSGNAKTSGGDAPKINEFTLNFQVKRAAAPPLDLKPASAPGGKAPAAKAPGAKA
jgi:type IV pilus assembly protein PilO